MRSVSLCLLICFLCGCTSYPAGAPPVDNFVLDRYLGQWHEIARLDHRFERGLSKVTAQYERREDGGVRVINRGYDAEAGEWKEAEGRAYFVGDTSVAHLKVSFFGPFYASYVVFGLGENYQHAFVSGPDHDYLWLLAREPEVSEDVWQSFLLKAEQAGFDTGALIRP